MKKVYLKPFYGKVFEGNKIFEINNGHNIFYRIDWRLLRNGVKVETIDRFFLKKGEADTFVYCDIPYPWEGRLWKDLITHRNKNLLLNFESPLVNPFSQMKWLGTFFEKVYTWNDELVDDKKYFKFCIPQLGDGFRKTGTPFEKRGFMVMVVSNRNSPLPFRMLSPYRSNGYAKRREIIEYFEKNESGLLDLYGRGWEGTPVSQYRVFKGEIKGNNKLKYLSKYRFCLCFENVSAPGYITEKIFDCFKAGCVPVYWGAPDVTKYIDRECFIDTRDYSGDEELLEYLQSISERRHAKYLEKARLFWESKDTKEKWFGGKLERILQNEG